MSKPEELCKVLKIEYENAHCALNFRSGFELLILARLSAQCTDSRVNKVSIDLFKKFPNIHSFAVADVEEIENIIKPCGMFKVKSKNLKDMCVILEKKFDSKIPYGMENLQSLPGIGRKTANLIMSEIFGQPSIIVDTHVSRVTRKLGLHNEKDPLKIEMILQNLINKSDWSTFSHCIVSHGRNICKARSPLCSKCCIKKYCDFFEENYEKKND